jgi:molybdopterin converting factor subunit 1
MREKMGEMLDAKARPGYDRTAMRVHVRYFAVVRERLGRETEEIDLPDGADVRAALDALSGRHPSLAALRPYLQVAVNQESAPATTLLADGDELALIPPVAGGADRLARVVADRPPSVEMVMAAVRGPMTGGVAIFVGLVRARSQGHEVTRLEYEAYTEMAEKVFRDLCDEIEARHEGVRLAVEHRTGTLEVGDVAVAIAAGAPHRGEAFRACQEMIDLLKERAPIWKKETGPDGTSWVGMGP